MISYDSMKVISKICHTATREEKIWTKEEMSDNFTFLFKIYYF